MTKHRGQVWDKNGNIHRTIWYEIWSDAYKATERLAKKYGVSFDIKDSLFRGKI